MICKVRCSKRASIVLPEGIEARVGDTLPCPSGCKAKSPTCGSIQEFKVSSSNMVNGPTAGFTYTDEEKERNWHTDTVPSVATPVAEPTPPITSTLDKYQSATRPTEGASSLGKYQAYAQTVSEGSTLSKYQMAAGQPAKAPAEAEDSFIKFDRKKYSEIIIGGVLFTNNPVRDMLCEPLNNALEYIFLHWETSCVFKGVRNTRELNDRFLWLLSVAVHRKIEKSEITSILENDSYSRSQKFFYLFYGVVFKQKRPKGFYWYDGSMSTDVQTKKFSDIRDFSKKYLEKGPNGEAFREYYESHKKEILFYLNVEDEAQFLESITIQEGNSQNQIQFLSKDGKIVTLGTTGTFVREMINPSTPLDRKSQMVAFLKEYRITGDGRILKRDNQTHPFKTFNLEPRQVDDRVYEALGFSSSSQYLTELNYYFTLICEYTRVFNPANIKIGEMFFTRANLSREIISLTERFCQIAFGADVPDHLRNQAIGEAWVAKLLYENRVLTGFLLQNPKSIEEKLEILEREMKNSKQKELALRSFFEEHRNPQIYIVDKLVPVGQYVRERIRFLEPYAICTFVEKDVLTKEFLASKDQEDGKTDLDALFRTYEESFKSFKK